MGCSNDKMNSFVYNQLSDKELASDGAGPFVNPFYSNYKENVEKYKNETWISALNKTISENTSRNCLGYRKALSETEFEKKHTYVTFGDVSNWATNFARNMKEKKLLDTKTYDFEGEQTILGIFARNCTEWLITDLACQRDSVTSVTFYATLGDQAFDHIFEQTNTTTVCVSNDAIDNLLKYHKEFNFKSLKNVIIYDMTLFSNKEMFDKIEKAGLKAYSFVELTKSSNEEIKLVESKADTIMTLCYTSGTTSLPKGVKISQNNFYAGQFSINDSYAPIDTTTVHFSYLPLAHIMERICLNLIFGRGGLSCFIASGDVKKYLAEDILLTRPTIMVAVPRVLTMFHQIITAEFKKVTGCAKTMLDRAYNAKLANFKSSGILTHSVYDKLVFAKVQNKFGGRIKYFLSGSAPLPKEVGDDMKIFFSAPILEAYGMTETTGAVIVSNINDTRNLTAGGVVRISQLKLADRKEMNYHSKTMLGDEASPSGEICVRGLNITKGYFLEKKKTEEAFDEDWIKTGDVGRILPDNKGLKIIDRVKELFKLSQGEYIAPSRLENVYVKNRFIMQICVYGNSLESYLIAIICPNKAEVSKFLVEKGIATKDDDVENYYENKDLLAEIKSTFDELAKVNKFNSLEKPLKFILSKVDFSVQNELVTPTMKLCRNKISDFFKDQIKAKYAEK